MSFLYPNILFLLAACIVPIVLHLLKKVKRKKIPFPYIFLFKNKIQHRNRVNRIFELLLLILRILILIIVIFALAKPFILKKNVLNSRQVNIFVDNTPSLLYRHNRETLINHLKKRVKQVLPGKNKNFKYNIIFADGKISVGIDRETVNSLIDNLKVVKTKITPENAVSLLVKNDKSKNKRILIFSDFRKNRYNTFALLKSMVLVRIGPSDRRNVGININNSFERLFFHGEKIHLSFNLNNYSTIKENVLVKLYNENKVIFEKVYTLKPRENKYSKANILLKYRHNNFKFVISRDNFPYDDIQKFSIKVRKKLFVLILGKNERENILIKNSLFLNEMIERRDISIDFVKKRKTYDIVLISNFKVPNINRIKGKLCSVIFLKNNYSLKIQNRILKQILPYLKIKSVNRKKLTLKIDKSFKVPITFPGVFFKRSFNIDTAYKGYFTLGNGKFVYVTKGAIILTADIAFNNSNFLLSGRLPLILDRLFYEAINEKVIVKKDIFSKNDSDILNIKNLGNVDTLLKIKKQFKRINFDIYLYLIVILLIIIETLVSSRAKNVKNSQISRNALKANK